MIKLSNRTISIIILFTVCTISCLAKEVIVAMPKASPEIDYALGKLEYTLNQRGVSLQKKIGDVGDFILLSANNTDPDCNDGYTIHKNGKQYTIRAENNRGIMYGILDINEQLLHGNEIDAISEKAVKAHFPFRAIKFNLPWYSYRNGENLSIHKETCKDLKFWESFLDMMVENKFNVLSLWSMHPYMYMVRSESFPDACPFSEEEMAEWNRFWKSLFAMAKERGISTYIINWNIFVSKEFDAHYGVKREETDRDYIGEAVNSPEIEKYTRELITQTINEYEDLTGIGLTLGERMGEMTPEERRDWVDRTIIAGLRDANRKARLVYRAPLSAGKKSGGSTSVSTEKLTRNYIENIEMDNDVWVEFKFNWSHGHTSPRLSIVHGGMLTETYWEPLSDKYKAIWTMRNEDFFVLRWAQSDFIREFIRLNSQSHAGGCFIGSECYIPAKDFFTKTEHQHWDYAFQRQWLFYKIWGNLLFNPETPDSYFADALESKFPGVNGLDLLKAWKLSSNSANRLGSFYRATWDGSLYCEGFAQRYGKIITVEDLIKNPPLDDKLYMGISEFVNSNSNDPKRINPLQLADQLESDGQEALRLAMVAQTMSDSKVLHIELNDIVTWVWHGKYFAKKLRGGVALARYRKTMDKTYQEEAIKQLTAAKDCWLKLFEHVEKYNVELMPYQFDQEYSWRKQLPLVEKDIEIAKE